tara:strand:- start:11084 stop:11677 length:594 start_codon:yes stop_codon:yes gene_type:complete
MTFDKLADRCLLFVDERKQMLIELLKEAELELTRRCNIYEMHEFIGNISSSMESFRLPSNYKQIIQITYDGDKLYPIEEDEVDYDNSTSTHGLRTGTPTGYFIRNESLILDRLPSSGTIRYSYYATVDEIQDQDADPSPIISMQYHRDLCDYAVAVAYAKTDSGMHDKFIGYWENSIARIMEQQRDRELIHEIKGEI